MKFEKLKFF